MRHGEFRLERPAIRAQVDQLVREELAAGRDDGQAGAQDGAARGLRDLQHGRGRQRRTRTESLRRMSERPAREMLLASPPSVYLTTNSLISLPFVALRKCFGVSSSDLIPHTLSSLIALAKASTIPTECPMFFELFIAYGRVIGSRREIKSIAEPIP